MAKNTQLFSINSVKLRYWSHIYETFAARIQFKINKIRQSGSSPIQVQSNALNSPMFFLKKWPHRLLLLPKFKSDSGSGSGFSQIFDSGSGEKSQNPGGIDSGIPDRSHLCYLAEMNMDLELDINPTDLQFFWWIWIS